MRFLAFLSLCLLSLFSVQAKEPSIDITFKLDVKKLAPGRHQFFFNAGYRNTGDPILVPVIVLKGEKPGKRLMLTAAIHGDELNGIRVLHKLAAEIDLAHLQGTITLVPGLNRPGMEAHSRYYTESGGGGTQMNLNRIMPGKETGSPAERYAYKLWENLLSPNADMAIDLHTQTRGTAYPLYVFSDFRNRTAKALAFSLSPDIIKDDPGLKGTLETSYINAQIPAVTYEIGAPKLFQPDLIDRAVKGLFRVLKDNNFYTADCHCRADVVPFVGRQTTDIKTDKAGILVLDVALLDRVKKGDQLGCLYDQFGKKQLCYTAPHPGKVLAIATDPLREVGTMVVRLIY